MTVKPISDNKKQFLNLLLLGNEQGVCLFEKKYEY